jgi:ADP-ribose pyrophosphatase YjhB (NUDIX family)
MGRRIKPGAEGFGLHAMPGGAVEPGELVVQCALRELGEEVGVNLRPEDFQPAGWYESGGHITLYLTAEMPDDMEPQNLEPHKCEGWGWQDPASLDFRDLAVWDHCYEAVMRQHAIRSLAPLSVRLLGGLTAR